MAARPGPAHRALRRRADRLRLRRSLRRRPPARAGPRRRRARAGADGSTHRDHRRRGGLRRARPGHRAHPHPTRRRRRLHHPRARQGRAWRGGGPAGDLVVETEVRPHPRVRRDGLDLYLSVPVDLDEAYRGASIEVPTFDGPVMLKVPPRSQAGTRLRLRGKGVTRKDRRGDLYVELDVRMPDLEDPALAEALGKSKQAYGQPVREGFTL
ncbi:MAG: DnaJ C-terminal domain-containing protein [Kofleriaceae bacterium]